MVESFYECPDALCGYQAKMKTGEDIYANVAVIRRPTQHTPVAQKSGHLKLAVVGLALLCVVLLTAVIGVSFGSASEKAALQNQICNLEWTVKRYRVNITLDPDTAHPHLLLSSDLKQVRRDETKQNYAENPKRFVKRTAVLGAQSLFEKKYYYEVEVRGKISWTLGVVRESYERNGSTTLPADGFWGIWLKYNRGTKIYRAQEKYLDVEQEPERVGVFVDYPGGSVSFYDADRWNELYSFKQSDFREKLYPYFNPSSASGGKNISPLIIHTPTLCL